MPCLQWRQTSKHFETNLFSVSDIWMKFRNRSGGERGSKQEKVFEFNFSHHMNVKHPGAILKNIFEGGQVMCWLKSSKRFLCLNAPYKVVLLWGKPCRSGRKFPLTRDINRQSKSFMRTNFSFITLPVANCWLFREAKIICNAIKSMWTQWVEKNLKTCSEQFIIIAASNCLMLNYRIIWTNCYFRSQPNLFH